MKSPLSFAHLLLVGSLLVSLTLAERPSHVLKVRRSGYINEPSAALARSNDAAAAAAFELAGDQDKLSVVPAGASAAAAAGAAGSVGAANGGNNKKDASSGRLFLKKFLMFKNMFGSSSQPVIPIIITNPGTTSTAPTSPTVTVTSTGTIPTATGTITATPTSPTSTSPTSPTSTSTARQYGADDQDDELANDDGADDGSDGAAAGGIAMAANAELLDEQAMQAALAAGAQEYEVFTNGDQADESKASQSNRINLRRKGGRRGQGQMLSVRIPPRYRRYFKNGQKVMLNTKSRPNKRRVVRKRVQNKNKRINNRRRGGKNKNKKGKGKGKNKNKNKRTRIPVA
ncbi:uncharacterized protein LOC132795542 [Drosophila nasuta]|uniref:uncharacterized protein LOC132795542 n=1 Tax=Drosophila nasuta TaxID=42062 RepID=UPI00295E9FD5|nr:uncharacterized protein LOC132795542 [Drosophila nasuta]